MALLTSSSAFAQMPTISSADNAVAFQKLQIDVRIVGNIATSTWTMTFVNNTSRIMEGNLTFPLGEGVVVDNYAIDINGKMRQAVPVEKAKATTVFEDITRRGVDPGILEKIEGNSFRTRIYPIAAHGVRTVSIGFNEEIPVEDNMLKMNLPLAFKEQFKEFVINVSVVENALRPKIISDEQLIFDKVDQTYNLKKTFQNYIPNKPLTIIVPKKMDVPEVIVSKVANDYFFLANVMIKGQQKAKPAPKHITILWDQSLSAESRNLEKELDLLDAYFKKIQQVTVRLIGFSNDVIEDKNFSIVGGNWEKLKDELKTTIYDGATNYSSIDLKNYKTDEFLLFSDGLANFIGESIKLSKTAVYSIASNPKSDYAVLKGIANKSNGEFINLNSLNTNQALNVLNNQLLKFIGIKEDVATDSKVTTSLLNKITNEFYPTLPTIVSGNFMLSGRVSNLNREIILQFGFGNQVVEERKINLKDSHSSEIDITRIWVAKKINELDLNYAENKQVIESLGKKYGIVTRNTSLMVLEEVRDYIRYNIDPPAELLEEYNRLRGRTPNDNSDFENSTFDLTYLPERYDSWYKGKGKWGRRAQNFNEMSDFSVAEEMVLESVIAVSADEYNSDASIPQYEAAKTPANAQKSIMADKMQTKTADKDAPSNSQQSATGFKAHVAGDDAYILELEKSRDAYKTYLECREKYKTSTKFYFDVAQFFADRKEYGLAVRVLSNIAELDQENYELYKGLGFKLKAMGQHHAASYVFKKVLDWRPMEPQSYRDYGLSLADEGKLQEGLDVLTEGFTRKYANNIPNIFHGIQEIFHTDINALVAKNPHLRVKEEIKKYIMPVDSDVRIIMSWNLGNSYIDLHITDPNGEKCDYRNLTTSTGGQFSTDFSGGFGPREFIQKKAVKGTYLIQTNYYGDNIQRIAGPAMIMVEIYRNFGTAKEERTIVALHPSVTRGNMFDVGELVFE